MFIKFPGVSNRRLLAPRTALTHFIIWWFCSAPSRPCACLEIKISVQLLLFFSPLRSKLRVFLRGRLEKSLCSEQMFFPVLFSVCALQRLNHPQPRGDEEANTSRG